jgi:hypothetical protein
VSRDVIRPPSRLVFWMGLALTNDWTSIVDRSPAEVGERRVQAAFRRRAPGAKRGQMAIVNFRWNGARWWFVNAFAGTEPIAPDQVNELLESEVSDG